MPLVNYIRFLELIHEKIRPNVYLEIGGQQDKTISLAKGIALGVAPRQPVSETIAPSVLVFENSSDEFFGSHDVLRYTNGDSIDFSFFEEIRLFDGALQDFINIERYSHSGTIVCMHDVPQPTPYMAGQSSPPDGWEGDIVAIARALQKYRPDLFVAMLKTFQGIMLVISNLDADSNVLRQNLACIKSDHMVHGRDHVARNWRGALEAMECADLVVDYLSCRANLAIEMANIRKIERLISLEPQFQNVFLD